MGKSTISMVIFNSYVTNYQRVVHGKFSSASDGDLPFEIYSTKPKD
jgi:hypothetical protein